MYETGTIVLAAFPFLDFRKFKIRPVLIVSNLVEGEIVGAYITSQLWRKNCFCQKIVRGDKFFLSSGLKKDSIVMANRISTMSKEHIFGAIGVIPKDLLCQIQRKLKMLLELEV